MALNITPLKTAILLLVAFLVGRSSRNIISYKNLTVRNPVIGGSQK